uniref:Protein kinase domain-containing protein n=1 Tax=Fagus sylvatica TaxID=28930 RepID=A0A2N9IX28_FAGSY
MCSSPADRLEEAKQAIRLSTGIDVAVFVADVRDYDAVSKAINETEPIDVLIYGWMCNEFGCAGVGGLAGCGVACRGGGGFVGVGLGGLRGGLWGGLRGGFRWLAGSGGQVSFKAPRGTYRVTGIDPNTRMFLIQVKGGGNPWLNQSLPFNLTSPRNSSSKISSEVTDDVEIVWEPPLEPICNLPADCKDWPYSTCKSARDGKRSFFGIRKKDDISSYCWNNYCDYSLRHYFYVHMAKKDGQETRQIDQRNQAHCIYTYNERHVQDLIDAGEFNEEDEKGIDVPFYDLESILVATDNFSNENKLGQGGYGPVFKGKLPSGQEIAVNRLLSVSSQGLEVVDRQQDAGFNG